MTFQFLEMENLIKNVSLSKRYICKKCNGPTKITFKMDLSYYRCTWSKCRRQESIWLNTIFQRCHLSKEKLFNLLQFWFEGLPPRHICSILALNNKTYTRIMKKVLLLSVKNFYERLSTKIGGNGCIVEIDESKFGRRKYNKGHKVDGIWVLGIVERSSERKIYLEIVDNRKSTTLSKIIEKNVDKNSIIYTDLWKGYKNLKFHFLKHETVNHSKFFKDPITGVHTNTIEGNWCSIKKGIPYRFRTKTLVSLYLVRFMLKRNFKNNSFLEFIKLLF